MRVGRRPLVAVCASPTPHVSSLQPPQYFRVYSPVAFPKKTDPEGHYVRKWLPALRGLPAAYIYEPWRAPRDVLKVRVGAELRSWGDVFNARCPAAAGGCPSGA